jgi:2-polyprenyl-6-methoxyphenol hydroxylase-like FAD-dependent oxidoreductase
MADADVVLVGFRCAGAPLAHALNRAGVKVIVVEKDRLFTDQPMSTHAIQPFGMKVLDKLGLGDVVRGLAPPNRAFRFQVERSYLQMELDGTDLDSRAPRRSKLDPALQRAALAAGVDARDRHVVTALLRDGDRVTGVRVKNGARAYELRAPLVVGADGRSSTIARLVGAETYLESTNPGALYWSYFEQTPVFTSDPRYDWGACIHVEGREVRAVFRTDSDLLLMAGGGRREMVEGWRGDPASALVTHLRRGRLTAPLVEGARMVAPPRGLLSLHFFMKRAVGPGWALVGDAGLHLDPTPGLGISDAFRDADALAAAIVDGGERAMRVFWRRRDADSIGLYHFAGDMGSEDYNNNPFTRMIFDRAQNSPAMKRRMVRMMERELRPLDMIPATRVFAWLFAESASGNLSPWSYLRRAMRVGRRVVRHQAILDRALERAEGGDRDDTLPSLPL